jgi:hypothetical protein
VIEAVIVNHNTSPFAELCLRTLAQAVPALDEPVQITVMDNHSTDGGVGDLREAASATGATFALSRWPASQTKVNTHGDVLRDFVRARPRADRFLFLDADIVFVDRETLLTLRRDLLGHPNRWAVQAQFAWSAHVRGGGSSLDMGAGDPQHLYVSFEDPGSKWQTTFPVIGVGQRRCHPGCTLIQCSPEFLLTAERFGFATSVVLSADTSVAGYYDTMALASGVMSTHGLEYALSDARVVHYFNVSYDERAELTQLKLADVSRRLEILRASPDAQTDPGPWG